MRNWNAFHVGFSIDIKWHNIIVKSFLLYQRQWIETLACMCYQSLPKQAYTCPVKLRRSLDGRGGI